MGLFKRLHRITMGRVEAFLDRVEDPEIMFPRLVKEMQEQFRCATEQEAAAVAAVKRAEHAVDTAREKADSLGRGAALALKQGDEATAREALTAQIDAEDTLVNAGRDLETLQSSVHLANAARRQIQEQLEELRAKKSELLTRARVARTRKTIQRTVSGSIGSTDSILDAVARLEASVEEDEAELEIQANLAGDVRVNPSLARRLEQLDRDSEIETRLAALKAKMPSRPVETH